jgi:hypothetical protein
MATQSDMEDKVKEIAVQIMRAEGEIRCVT